MEKDAATVLEDAADLLLLEGRCRDSAYGDNGERCVLAAIADVSVGTHRFNPTQCPAWLLLKDRIPAGVVLWNRETADDFEVIDTLRLVAKEIRNGEAG